MQKYLILMIFLFSCDKKSDHIHEHHENHQNHAHHKTQEKIDHKAHIAHMAQQTIIGESCTSCDSAEKVKVVVSDKMKIELNKTEFKINEVIEFEITNKGNINHEFSIATKDEHIAHQQMMMEHRDMEHKSGNTLTIKPGETKTLKFVFNEKALTEEVLISCNVEGHSQLGMNEKITFINKD